MQNYTETRKMGRASLSSADSAASLSLICCSLASLSSTDSAARLSLIRCSLTALSSADWAVSSAVVWPLFFQLTQQLPCINDCLCSTVWAARLSLSLILRILIKSLLPLFGCFRSTTGSFSSSPSLEPSCSSKEVPWQPNKLSISNCVNNVRVQTIESKIQQWLHHG